MLVYDNLVRTLAPHGYHPIPHTVGLWAHETRPTTFCLCVDDFGIKYFNKADADHLLHALGTKYTTSVDGSGKNFCGLTIDWHYEKNCVDISMPGYIRKLLQKLQHFMKKNPQYTPFPVAPYKPPKKGQRQYAPQPDTSTKLDASETKYIQSIVGSLLYYARAIDSTILPALNTISKSQASPTTLTKLQCNLLLDYCTT